MVVTNVAEDYYLWITHGESQSNRQHLPNESYEDQGLTESLVENLQPPEVGNKITYDGTIPGFGVRITAAGAIAFILNYRIRGQERRVTIGRYPDWSLEEARRHAEKLRHQITKGDDPLDYYPAIEAQR
jgi:hypothetical protein